MSPRRTQSLIELAQEVQHNAAILEAELRKANFPSPTFAEDGPSGYPSAITHPDLQRARTELITACSTLTDLARGPTDQLKDISNLDALRSVVLRVIDYYRIDQLVPSHGSISYDNLGAKLNMYPGILQRILRYAMTFHFFAETSDGNSVTHTSVSRAFPNIQPWVRLATSGHVRRAFEKIVDALEVYSEPLKYEKSETQIPFAIAHDGKAFFEVLQESKDKMFNMDMFSSAMKSFTANSAGLTNEFIVRGFDWGALGEGTVVDVGGGNGYIAAAIAKAFPKLRLVVQDLPINEGPASQAIPDDLKGRVTFMAHDFFTPQPEGLAPKAYFMKSILHDWSDEDCVKILTNLVPSFEKDVRLFDVDRIMPKPGERPEHEEAAMRFADMLMFSMLAAKERDLANWERLCDMVDPRLKVKSWKTPQGSEWAMLEIGF